MPTTSPSEIARAQQLADAWADLLLGAIGDAEQDDELWDLVTVSDMEPVARGFARSHDLTLLGCGEERCVFAGRDLPALGVLKLPHGWHGDQANVMEALRWRRAGQQERRILAPVMASAPDGKWLIMQYADPVEGVELLQDRLHDWMATKRQAHRAGLTDVHKWNLGLLEDRVVVVDYSHNPSSPPVRVGVLRRRLLR